MRRNRFNGLFYYVYVTTNLVNGKQYVGSRKTKKNLIENEPYLGSGLCILKAFKKYGRSNFKKEIIKIFPNQREAFLAEVYYINYYNSLLPNGYNISPTGGLGVPHCHSKETQKIINDKLKIIKNTSEFKIKRSQISKKLMESVELKEKIRKGVLKYNSENPEQAKLINQKRKETMNSPEYKKRISEKTKQYYEETPDACRKNSEAVKKYYKETEGAYEKNRIAVKKAMNTPEMHEKLSKMQLKRFQNISFEVWSEQQKKALNNPLTKEKMSISAKNRIVTNICKQCETTYSKKSMNQFNKDLCDTCRKEKYKKYPSMKRTNFKIIRTK